jgi:hypothetical protein
MWRQTNLTYNEAIHMPDHEKTYPHVIETKEKRYKLVACEIMFREVCYLLSQTHKVIDVTFLPKGLHDMGEEKMTAVIQEELDKIEPEKYQAVLLGYGLCNNGVRGLHAKTPLVIPRAHDCITLFLGSRGRYKEYFQANPGTYYKTSGWIEREVGFLPQGGVMDKLGLNKTYEEYVEEYGEENAQYLMEMLGGWTDNYNKMTFINMSFRRDDGSEVVFGDLSAHMLQTRQKADELGWQFEEAAGDITLLEKFINCDWNDDDFLIVPPERKITVTNADDIMAFE